MRSLLVFGIIAATLCCPAANADPSSQAVINYAHHNAAAVCSTLDDFPTLPGVSGVLAGVQNDSGFTASDAAWIVVYAVNTQCSRHLPLLDRFITTYAPATTAPGAAA